MQRESLNGQWTARCAQQNVSVPASVPGDVYHDLIKAGSIPDPYDRDNEKQCLWVGENDWTLARAFVVSEAMIKSERVVLRCHGLDTLATIELNGQRVGTTDNMHRTWEFDVKKLLVKGPNQIMVGFESPRAFIDAKTRKRRLYGDTHNMGYLRKEHCNFGWDWGLNALTCGIWRDIELLAFDTGRIADVAVMQDHRCKGQVTLKVGVRAERTARVKLAAKVTVSLGSEVVGSVHIDMPGREGHAELTIKDAKLWWPNTMGEQPLYEVTVELCTRDGDVLDRRVQRMGLRTLVLDRHEDPWGESFQFVVNGVPFFAKGANWIPADAVLPRMNAKRYRALLQDAAAANMNMLRVWGGGIYEHDVFYEICDELGLCVWQDFMFACATYPVMDKRFMKNVKAEAEDNVRRLRHHACMALWCGNNELEMFSKTTTAQMNGWEGYGSLFDVLLRDVVAEFHPSCSYWPSSPHSPHGDRANHSNPTCGDAHLWDVWHGRKPFEWYRTCEHRFNSEFGFQSFPEPKTVRAFTRETDRNITAPVMEHHQRSWVGNAAIMQYMLDWFRMPKDFDSTLWASQILQGMAIKYAVEHWRRSMPRGMGTLYWQFNDCWPVASGSSGDYYGRWKALHYMARAFFAPVLLSGLEDKEKGTVEIHVTSDRLKSKPATVSWVVTDVAGKRLLDGDAKLRTPVNGDRRVKTLRLRKLLDAQGDTDLLVWLELHAEGEPAQRNLVLFARPKQLELSKHPGVSASVKANTDGTFSVTLKTKRVALWTWLELQGMDAALSWNFFHLRPGMTECVIMAPAKKLSARQCEQRLSIRSLVDTF